MMKDTDISDKSKIVYLFKDYLDLSFIEIKMGDFVVIKPNLIRQARQGTEDQWECVITNEPLIRAVCEYVCARLGRNGRVVICDAPQTDSSFNDIVSLLHLQKIVEECRKKYDRVIEIFDLRKEEWKTVEEVVIQRKKLNGDPNGDVIFNLKDKSLLYKHPGEGRYYGADYNASVVNSHHNGLTHEYLLAKTPIQADVFINLPKLKTHKKTGVTLSLKNVVGINADKNWLPHHANGAPKSGGDQFPNMSFKQIIEHYLVQCTRYGALNLPYVGPKIAQRLRRIGKKAFGSSDSTARSGNWYGNNTTWRMALDLNRCLLYGNPDGTFDETNKKRYYTVIDGITGMQGMGPASGTPVSSGVYIGGSDPVLVDTVAARFMGFDWRKIPIISQAYKLNTLRISKFTVEDILVKSNVNHWNGRFLELEKNNYFMKFEPPFAWKDHIEYSPDPVI